MSDFRRRTWLVPDYQSIMAFPSPSNWLRTTRSIRCHVCRSLFLRAKVVVLTVQGDCRNAPLSQFFRVSSFHNNVTCGVGRYMKKASWSPGGSQTLATVLRCSPNEAARSLADEALDTVSTKFLQQFDEFNSCCIGKQPSSPESGAAVYPKLTPEQALHALVSDCFGTALTCRTFSDQVEHGIRRKWNIDSGGSGTANPGSGTRNPEEVEHRFRRKWNSGSGGRERSSVA